MSNNNSTSETPETKSTKRNVIVILVTTIVLVFFGRSPLASWMNSKARQAMSEGELETSRAWLDRSATIASGQAEVALLESRYHRRSGDIQQAYDYLKLAQESGYPQNLVEYEQAMLLAQLGRLAECQHRFGDMLAEPGSDGAEICRAIAAGYLLVSDFAKASLILDGWEADFPNSAQPHLVRGKMFESTQQWNAAKHAYERVLSISPENVEAARGLANCLMHNNEAEAALQYYRIAVRNGVKSVKLYSEVAHCLRLLGDHREAANWLDRAFEIDPTDFNAAFEKGELELEAGNYKAAADSFRIAIDKEPNDTDARFGFASAQYLDGNKELAKSEFDWIKKAQKALLEVEELTPVVMKDPKDVETRFKVASILLEFGKSSDAIGWFKSVLNIDSDHKPTHQKLADYYRSRASESDDIKRLAEEHQKLAE